MVFLPAGPGRARTDAGDGRAASHRGRAAGARLARRAGGQQRCWARACCRPSPWSARSSSAAAPTARTRTAFERKLFVIRKRMDNEIRAAGFDKTAFYVTSLSSRTIVYKGMLLADQVGVLLPGPARRAHRLGPGPGASALLDQHLPDLGSGPPLPHDLPQRRDQHPARQPQLDGGAPPHHALGGPGRRPGQHLAADPRGPVRLGLLRQCAGTAGDGRLLAWPTP